MNNFKKLIPVEALAFKFIRTQLRTMSNEEDLIDYSDEELQTNDAAATEPSGATTNGHSTKKGDLTVSGGNADKKGSYVGIHATGFRDFLLKPELLRASTDCGFEHPSEGQS